MAKTFNTSIEYRLGCLWITFKDSIDMDNYKIIENNIYIKIEESDAKDIVLDLSKTLALFSSCLGIIIRLNTYAGKNNKKLFLVNVSKKVREGLITTGLNKVLTIYSTFEELQSELGNLYTDN